MSTLPQITPLASHSSLKSGDKFSRLTIIDPVGSMDRNHHRLLLCKCDCGTERYLPWNDIRRGSIRSCGCLQRELLSARATTHGETKCRLYRVWSGMKTRCSNPNASGYGSWGGRGITICDEWKEYGPFANWARANGFQEHLEIDRVDNDGPYSPQNCRWVTRKQNSRNKRSSRILTAFGESKTVVEWAEDERCSVNAACIRSRLNYGYSHEAAISYPKCDNPCGKRYGDY